MVRMLPIFLLILSFSAAALAEVEWQVVQSLQLPSSPVDVTTSGDGQRVFVLLENGEVRVYDAGGTLQESVRLGLGADRIAVTPDGERLLLSDAKGRQVRMVALDFIKPIDISGSPFKGPDDAKVVVAVYSDFQ